MTIKDLAAKTGYSVGTISRVLNNHPHASQKAREIILKAVEDSGFQLNENARQLKQQHATSILVVVKGTSNELFAELLQAIQSRMDQTGYPLIVDYLDEYANEVLRAVQLCREKKPLGILFLGGNKRNFQSDFDKIDIPCVLVTNDAGGQKFPNLSCVYTDDRQAAKAAIDALVALGHRRFAVVGGDLKISDTSQLRYSGCLDSFREHGIAFDEKLDYQGVRYSYAGGYEATRKLLESGRQFTALFAAADVMAIGAIRALRDKGLRVPEDVSVIGFDDLPLSKYLVPQLSTVEQSVEVMAKRSVEILLSCIEKGSNPVSQTAPFIVHTRESTRNISK
jgi:LacI family transcriptional regulator